MHAALLDLSQCFFNGDFEAAVTGTQRTWAFPSAIAAFFPAPGCPFPFAT